MYLFTARWCLAVENLSTPLQYFFCADLDPLRRAADILLNVNPFSGSDCKTTTSSGGSTTLAHRSSDRSYSAALLTPRCVDMATFPNFASATPRSAWKAASLALCCPSVKSRWLMVPSKLLSVHGAHNSLYAIRDMSAKKLSIHSDLS